MIAHHLVDDLLIDYAAGILAESWSIGVATHLALCPICRKRLDDYEGIGGHFLECEEAPSSDAGDWNDMLARIRSSKPDAAVVPTRSADELLPQPLRSYVETAGGLKWRKLPGGAARMKIRTSDRKATIMLLKIPAGQSVPEHSHGGLELSVVLSGRFHDGNALYGRGDVEIADGSITHQPIATTDAECICLIIMDSPLKFTSRLVRLIQPFLGI
ncbi:MAG: ChrR family anti-sigma-E factor [Rhizobiaceae bacterium]|nr:ChrR family anti-sigma-E factor [Rhizobiaceae bacterium]